MGLRINTNIPSLNVQRQLHLVSRALGKTLERLSSGSRINRAGDDASGLAISSGLESQMKGLTRGVRNINDARGFLNTAEGALSTQTDILQRMRELALTAANGSIGNEERGYLNQELMQLLEEMDRLTNKASFNGTKLLTGDFTRQSIQVGPDRGNKVDISLESSASEDLFRKTVGNSRFAFDDLVEIRPANSFDYLNIHNGDLDGDDDQDVVLINDDDQTADIYLNDGKGVLEFSSQVSLGASQFFVSRLQLKDVDGDKNLDLVGIATLPSEITFMKGTGTGTFLSPVTRSVDAAPNDSEFADFNGDGILDIVFESDDTSSLMVSYGLGSGAFQNATELGPSSSNQFALADLNGDGFMDVVSDDIGNGNQIVVYLGDGNGGLLSTTAFVSDIFFSYDIEIADFDKDGHPDVVQSSGGNNEIEVQFGDGTGSFGNAVTFALSGGNSSVEIELGDVNGDGITDIVASGDGGRLQIFTSDGERGFTAGQTVQDFSYAAFAIADFDGNGALDLASVNGDGNFVLANGLSHEISARRDIDVSTQEAAQNLLQIIDDAMIKLQGVRSNIGALQQRLESAESSTLITRENLALAKSYILDAEVSTETAELARTQMLQHAGVSVLVQANVNSRVALELLTNI